jgi:hypothetical protein
MLSAILFRALGFIVRYGSVATPVPVAVFPAKRYLLLSVIIEEGVNRSLDFPWHNSMSLGGEETTAFAGGYTLFSYLHFIGCCLVA